MFVLFLMIVGRPCQLVAPSGMPHTGALRHFLTLSESRYSLRLTGGVLNTASTKSWGATEVLLKWKEIFLTKQKKNVQSVMDKPSEVGWTDNALTDLMSLRRQEKQMLSLVSVIKVIWERGNVHGCWK